MTDERPLETGWLDDTPTGDNLLRQFAFDQADVTATIAAGLGGSAAELPGALVAGSSAPIPYFNQATLTRPLTGAADPLLDEIEVWFGSVASPYMLLSMWPTPDLTDRGWSLVGHPALVVRSPNPIAHTPAGGVEIVTAASRDDLDTAARIVIEGYPIPEAAGRPLDEALPTALLGSPVTTRIGLLEGEPVAVGTVCVGHGVVNLCLGATLPAARRRGVWEALVWARAFEAPDLPAVAYTSDHSRPGFIRMGFTVVTRFTYWIRGT